MMLISTYKVLVSNYKVTEYFHNKESNSYIENDDCELKGMHAMLIIGVDIIKMGIYVFYWCERK